MIHFFIFLLTTILWSLSLFFYNNPIPVLFNTAEWFKITVVLTVVLVFELFCCIVAISKKPFKKYKIPLIISSCCGLSVILTVLIKQFPIFYPQTIIFFLLIFIYAGFWGAIAFERGLKNPALHHLQIMYILIGFGVFLAVITVFYIVLPIMKPQNEYFWLGPITAFLFVLFSVISYYSSKEKEKRTEEKELKEEWEKLSRAKEQFLLSIQHHLRTPLTPIKGYLEEILAGTYGREENPVIREKLIEMKKLTDTLYALIERLLDIQALKLGNKTLNLQNCQIEDLIEGVIEELKPQAEKKGLYLKYELPEKKLPSLKLDKKTIREAIWNLVDNAIKYTNRGGVIVELKIENCKLKITVKDTGIGMKKEEVDYFLQGKLFERGEEATKLYGPGRGIGLAIVSEIIRAHAGKIGAESEGQGKGTTFWIELPIEK